VEPGKQTIPRQGSNGSDYTAGSVGAGKDSTPGADSSFCIPEIPLAADEGDLDFVNPPPGYGRRRSQTDARDLVRQAACRVMESYPQGCTCHAPEGKSRALCPICQRFFRAARLILWLDGKSATKSAANEAGNDEPQEPEAYDGKWAAEQISRLNRAKTN